MEAAQVRRQDVLQEGDAQEPGPNRPDLAAHGLPGDTQRPIGQRQRTTGLDQQQFSRAGEFDPAARAGEDGTAHLALNALHLRTERRPGHLEPGCRAPEVTLFRDRCERAQTTQLHGTPPSSRTINSSHQPIGSITLEEAQSKP
ncbi:hypothetical protein GCM10020295_79960 [Streptomyces cinereospinus]